MPSDYPCTGIVLNPDDIQTDGDKANYLLLTSENMMKVTDYTDGNIALIQGSAESRLRAIELVQDLSTQYGAPFLYEEELSDLQERKKTVKTHLRGT